MYRPSLASLTHHHPWQWSESCSRLLPPLTLWICVSVILKYGYYGNCHMVLGPSSSRLFEVSSVFVKQIEVRDSERKGVHLYGFSEKPELSMETNWNVSNYVIVGSYSHKGFSFWLNKGSRIHMRWQAQTSSLGQLHVSLVKGEREFETLKPTSTSTSPDGHVLTKLLDGREAHYTIQENDKYYVGIRNENPRSIIMVLNLNVLSKEYDTTKAKSICSTISGSCGLNLPFASKQFVTVTTANNGDLVGWYIELSFVARLLTYIALLGFVVIIIFLLLKYLGACDIIDREEQEPLVREATEAHPLMPEKPIGFLYGTCEEDQECGSGSSSEDLYDGKICVICYDELRNCFFVPCGHCATCYDCAKRIMEAESKVCPICRRLVHKVRKLIIP